MYQNSMQVGEVCNRVFVIFAVINKQKNIKSYNLKNSVTFKNNFKNCNLCWLKLKRNIITSGSCAHI